ncbi:MAG: hypothetical protein WCY91_07945 [Acidithiobacillus sp.]|uniref:hypothetical protein n=1 Tax=Acidithiobacillus sp. TaxID=1872118 RepID=UPI00356114BD
MSDQGFLNWLLSMQDSTDYLHIDSLIPNMAYAIWARNAYVGIWIPGENGFLVSRYKIHSEPSLFVEYHWDIGEPLGTAKPLCPLGKSPLTIPSSSSYDDADLSSELCAWLDALEMHNPPLTGWDSVSERRRSAVSFGKRLTRKSD